MNIALKAAILTFASISSFSSFAVSVDIGEPESTEVVNLKEGKLVSDVYFYNGKWYLKAEKTDGVFGVVGNYIFNGAGHIRNEHDFTKKMNDVLLVNESVIKNNEILNSNELNLKYEKHEDGAVVAMCFKSDNSKKPQKIKNKIKSDYVCDKKFNFNKLISSSYNQEIVINAVKSNFSYNEIEMIVAENENNPMYLLGNFAFSSHYVESNTVFLYEGLKQ